jgi:hypothetical protein
MTIPTTISKIQVRRGPLGDLPILDEGEFGYALDYHRLFIGNTPITAIGDGIQTEFEIQDRTILPDQISVLVDDFEVNINVEYNVEGTKVVFANAPADQSVIKFNFNTEVKIQNSNDPHFRLPLENTTGSPYKDTGLSVSMMTANTMLIDYSLRTSNNLMRAGTLQIVVWTDYINTGDELHPIWKYVVSCKKIQDTAIKSQGDEVEFDIRVDEDTNRLYLTYTNETQHTVQGSNGTPVQVLDTANFYYSIKLWNTI